MKAQSAILKSAQRPMLMFGVPPTLFFIAVGIAFAVFGAFVGLDLLPLALIGSILSLAAMLVWLWRKTRQDVHFGQRVLLAPRFWRRRRSGGHLLTGQPPGGAA